MFVRLASFEPGVTNFNKRLFNAYAAEVARVDESDGQSNERLFIPATKFNRFAVTREINDGLLAPRFAPSQRAWVLTGFVHLVEPPVNASVPRDADNR